MEKLKEATERKEREELEERKERIRIRGTGETSEIWSTFKVETYLDGHPRLWQPSSRKEEEEEKEDDDREEDA